MIRRLRLLLLVPVLIVTDMAVFQALLSTTSAGASLSRLLSLGSLTLLFVLGRRAAASSSHQYPAGFLPLVIATFVLCYGTFVALVAQTPHVQPLVHLILSWFCALVFGILGWWRIRRWRT